MKQIKSVADLYAKAGFVVLAPDVFGRVEPGMIDCAVGYHGGNIEKYTDEAKNLHCRIMLHFGAIDTHIPQSTVDKIRTALNGKVHVEISVYENADYGFNCDQRKSYDRSQVILNKSLK